MKSGQNSYDLKQYFTLFNPVIFAVRLSFTV